MTVEYKKPLVLLTSQVIAIGLSLYALGRFQPQTMFDTASYANYSFANWTDALTSQRTFVYPLFLRAGFAIEPSGGAIPAMQFAIASLSAIVFWVLLCMIGWRPWIALAATSPLVWSPIVTSYTSVLTPDLLAQSIAIACAGFWLLWVRQSHSLVAIIGTSITCFLAYQTKPSYLFLIVMLPIGAGIARWLLHREQQNAVAFAGQVFTACVGPFLAFCMLRWIVVGHFGLVAFGGFNIVGISGQLLREDMLERLSPETEAFGRALWQQRQQRENWSSEISYDAVQQQFNAMVWEIAVPIAETQCQSDRVAMNRLMNQFSSEVIRLEPSLYLRWLWSAGKHAVRETAELTLQNPAVIAVLFLALWTEGTRTLRNQFTTSATDTIPHPFDAYEFRSMLWLSIGWALSKFMLVILVEPPNSRYSAPACLLIGCTVSILLALLCSTPRASRSNIPATA